VTQPVTRHPPRKEFRAVRDEVEAMLGAKHQASFAADGVVVLDRKRSGVRRLLIHQEQLIYLVAKFIDKTGRLADTFSVAVE
jgi:hypothetical protein